MKIVIVTQNDPFYIKHFFAELLKSYNSHEYEIVRVYFFTPMNDSLRGLVRRTYNFYGPRTFVRLGFRYLVAKVGERLGLPTTAYNFIRRAGIDVKRTRSVNTKGVLDFLVCNEVDLLVSVSSPQIFKKKLLSAPKLGALNIHSGKLPSYKGFFPNFWQMYNGEKFATVTVHEMAAKVDAGKIIAEERIKISKKDTLTRLIVKAKKRAARALIKVIRMYADNEIKSFENKQLKGEYYRFPTREDVQKFRTKGLRII